VSRGGQNPLKGLGIVGRVERNKTHSTFMDMIVNTFCYIFADFVVTNVRPPEENVRLIKKRIRTALLRHIKVGSLHNKLLWLCGLQTIGNGSAQVIGIEVFGGMGRVFVPY
jgi:hypothetical protein